MSLSVCSDPQEEGDDDLMFKMVFVVNMDLAMGVGKVRKEEPFSQALTSNIKNSYHWVYSSIKVFCYHTKPVFRLHQSGIL